MLKRLRNLPGKRWWAVLVLAPLSAGALFVAAGQSDSPVLGTYIGDAVRSGKNLFAGGAVHVAEACLANVRLSKNASDVERSSEFFGSLRHRANATAWREDGPQTHPPALRRAVAVPRRGAARVYRR